jgi:2-keto-4-pentenoate hydratase/2-oxohepta-3-ene-1,7-dioic acid hydratase in catechol pathway
MRLCRFRHQNCVEVGLYSEQGVWPLEALAASYREQSGAVLHLPDSHELLSFLPPAADGHAAAKHLDRWLSGTPQTRRPQPLAPEAVELLVPIEHPNKMFFLAGNYTEHILEGGGVAAERAETFPYVFMKPPSTTLTAPGQPVRIPAVSPSHVDWELELAVIIGKTTRRVSEADALSHVAGYTIINDISDRQFKPNPGRKTRPRDAFFDWLHGKWHDSFCPCGPCVVPADDIPDPQNLRLELKLNGGVRQSASTAQQIFPVAAVIEFISSFVTLEPGDIIATGTPSGVGHATGHYLKPGDLLAASIDAIGTLVSPVIADE